jgi:hypothetical protein
MYLDLVVADANRIVAKRFIGYRWRVKSIVNVAPLLPDLVTGAGKPKDHEVYVPRC